MHLTEAEDIKKRWQEHDQDNHDGVITHIEPDILECEVKWALLLLLLLLSRFSRVQLCVTSQMAAHQAQTPRGSPHSTSTCL